MLYCASTPPGVLDQCILLCCARIAALPSPRILICRGKALLLCCTVCTSKTPTLLFVRRRVAIFAVFSLVRTLLLPHARIPSTAPLTYCPRRHPTTHHEALLSVTGYILALLPDFCHGAFLLYCTVLTVAPHPPSVSSASVAHTNLVAPKVPTHWCSFTHDHRLRRADDTLRRGGHAWASQKEIRVLPTCFLGPVASSDASVAPHKRAPLQGRGGRGGPRLRYSTYSTVQRVASLR